MYHPQEQAVSGEEVSSSLLPKPSLKGFFANLFFLAITLGAIYFFAVYLGIDNLREKVLHAGIFAPLLVVLLKATTIVIVPLGGTPIYPIAGALFGFWKGFALTLAGDALGASIAFYLSRILGQRILGYVMGKAHTPTVLRLIEQFGDTKQFIKARIYFAGFPELFAYASGLTRVSFLLFLPVYMSVMALYSLLLVAFGDLLLSGNLFFILGLGLLSSILALAGVYSFTATLSQGS